MLKRSMFESDFSDTPSGDGERENTSSVLIGSHDRSRMSSVDKVTKFFTTRWTLVSDAVNGGDAKALNALGDLMETYWQPLYRYVRRRGKSQEDAEDLIQGFFAHLLQHNGLRLANRDRGRFRSFLLGSLKNHMANEWQREHRLKRGGFAVRISLDWKEGEAGLSIEPADNRSPDKEFDRDWAMAVLNKVLDDLENDDKNSDFGRWKPFLSMEGGNMQYSEIAVKFGTTEGAARVKIHRLRKRYRQRLREEIARTLADGQDVEEEIRSLFSALSN